MEDAHARTALLRALVEHRKALGLKQSDIAAHLNIGQQQVSNIEREISEASLATLQQYARAVGMRLALSLVHDIA